MGKSVVEEKEKTMGSVRAEMPEGRVSWWSQALFLWFTPVVVLARYEILWEICSNLRVSQNVYISCLLYIYIHIKL